MCDYPSTFLRAMLVLVALSLGGCPRRADYQGVTDYAVPNRTPAELAAVLASQCRAAQLAGQPLLLEFSASWCSDCRALATLKKGPKLAAALEGQVKIVEINVGDFDRHRELIDSFDIDRIATWLMVRPTDCSVPVSDWPRDARREVEPLSKSVSTADLINWLQPKGD